MRVFLLILVILCCTTTARADGGADWQNAAVVYVTGSTLYVGVGRAQGVKVGDVLEVVRGGVVVAKLVVQHVSSERSACDRVDGAGDVAVGDVVRYRAVESAAEAPPEGAAAPALAPVEQAEPWLRGHGIRGRVGLRQHAVIDQTGAGSNVVRPALDLRLEGREIGGSAFDVEADVRAHRSFGADEDGRTRVYRLLTRWEPASWSITLGRQASAALPNTGIFDGLAAELRGGRWSGGILSGTQPDPTDYGISGDIREHGLYAQLRGQAWSGVLGAIGSYQTGEVNREYVYIGGRFRAGRLSGSLRQEVDVNRQWRADVESSTLSPTSTVAQVNSQLGSTSLGIGIDNRRAVRLMRTRDTPETLFDDSVRQGIWARAGFRAGSARITLEGRNRRGAASGNADSGTLALHRVPLGSLSLRADARVTVYRNDLVKGTLVSLGLDALLSDRFSARAFGGQRIEQDQGNAFDDGSAWWLGLDAELSIAAGWLLAASLEHVAGGDDARETLYSGLSYRF